MLIATSSWPIRHARARFDYGFSHVGAVCAVCGGPYDFHASAVEVAAGITDQLQFNLATSFLLHAPTVDTPAWNDHLSPGLTYLAVRNDTFQLAASASAMVRLRGPGSFVHGLPFALSSRINASRLVFVDIDLPAVLYTENNPTLVTALRA